MCVIVRLSVLKGELELLSATYSRVAGRWRSAWQVVDDEDRVYVSPISSSTLRGVSASCGGGEEPQLQWSAQWASHQTLITADFNDSITQLCAHTHFEATTYLV